VRKLLTTLAVVAAAVPVAGCGSSHVATSADPPPATKIASLQQQFVSLIKRVSPSGDLDAATVVGRDVGNDLAVIHLSHSRPPAAKLADSSQVAVGDIAVALGNPLGAALQPGLVVPRA
jgi:S1-C subfamily serine protease